MPRTQCSGKHLAIPAYSTPLRTSSIFLLAWNEHRFFSVRGLRRELSEVTIGDNRFLIGTHPLVNAGTISCLSEAERAIAVDVVSGSSNSDIARRRGVSDHTVIDQVQSILEKLRVHSRGELAPRLQAREKDH
jgi:DNA-binding NarL/FixJ family response regulator